MNRRGSRHPITIARRATRRRIEGGDDGFTLIELLITITILPIVVGGLTAALLSIFGLQDQTRNRIGDSNDAQIGSITFNKDVQSAEMQETVATPPACGTTGQIQLLGLEWGANTAAPGGYDTVVSYIKSQTGSTYSLLRQVCQYATSPSPPTFTASPTSTAIISRDIGSPTLTITGGGCEQPSVAPPGQLCPWTSTEDVTLIQFSVDEPASNYSYTLAGLPGASVSGGPPPPVQPAQNPAGCNYAAPNPALPSALCFADFSTFDNSGPGTGCVGQTTGQQMSLSIAGSGDTLSFCISATPYNEVSPYYIPTYYNPGSSGYNSEAYLGNNGFYTGIPGRPALYQCKAGTPNIPAGCNGGGATNTVTITDILVTNSVGRAATGWTLVTGDAESTDSGEWMVFTTGLSGGWEILPNNGPSDLWGDACYDGPTPAPGSQPGDPNDDGALQWTGGAPTTTTVGNPAAGPPATSSALTINTTQNYTTGATSILCESDAQLNKTGTMMLSAPEGNSNAPQSLTVTMKGAGLEGMFLGVLL